MSYIHNSLPHLHRRRMILLGIHTIKTLVEGKQTKTFLNDRELLNAIKNIIDLKVKYDILNTK